MSTVNATTYQHESGAGSNITLDNQGNVVCAADIQSTSQNGGQLAGFRNQLINGGFRVAQRGDDFFSSAPADTDDPYTLDRWCVSSIASAQPTRVARQNNDAPPGFAWSVALYANGNPAGASRQSFIQAIELQRPGNNNQFVVGSTWTLSFWVKSIANSSIGVSAGFRPSAQTLGTTPEELSETVNTTTAWVQQSHTFTIANTADAGDQCFAVIFYNAVATNTSILLAGISLEPGPVATPFEQRPIGLELELCKRYYQYIDYSSNNGSQTTPGSGWYIYPIQFPVQMRQAPTVSASDAGSNTGDAIYQLVDGTSGTGFVVVNNYDTSIAIRGNNSTVTRFLRGRVKLDAEL